MAKVHNMASESQAQCTDVPAPNPHGGDESIHRELTVAVLLDEPRVRGVVVHEGDLGRRVDWCLPVDDALSEAGSLTGVVAVVRHTTLARGGDEVEEMIERLSKRGVSALFVSGAEASDLPSWQAKVAGAGPMTVVLAPPGSSYRVISRLVVEKSIAREAHVLAYATGVQRELSDVLYRGAGLTAMARRVSRMSWRPVYVLGSHFEVLAYESLGAGPVPDPDEIVRMLHEAITSGRVDPAPLDQERASVLVELALEHGTVSCVVAPIALGGTTYGLVAIVEMEQPPNHHDVAQHLVLTQQAALTAGAEILRLRSVDEAQERARGDFVHALLHERFSSPHELATRAAFHQFDVAAPYLVVVASGVFDPATGDGVSRLRTAMQDVRLMDVGKPGVTMATSVGDHLVVVRQAGAAGERERDVATEQAQAGAYAREIAAVLEPRAQGSLRVAYGRVGIGQPGVMHSYREARIALEIAARTRREGVAGYADLRVLAVLSDLAQSPDAVAYARDVLGPLRAKQDSDLEAVVTAYLGNGGNLNATSRELFMHRNTVLYKLDKASQLLGMDLRVAENRFTVWLAHHIQMLCEVEAAVDVELNPVPRLAGAV